MSTRAIVVREDDGGAVRAGVQQVELADPGKGETLLSVSHSSLNFKDAMAVAGRPGILRGLPMVPGIDAVGRTPDGRSLVVTGAGLGERRHGGLAEQVVIEHATAVPVPEAYTPRQAAAIGTAGVTAALAALALRRHGVHDGPVLVTGAGGGVGGYAVALLSALGHRVVASTGRRASLEEHLTRLGASEVVDRLDATPGRPLQQQRFAGVVDSVGGGPLVNAIAQTTQGGVVAACGLAASPNLPGTVLPFILRGVVLAGVDSVAITPDVRRAAWELLVAHVPGTVVDALTEREIGLDEVPAAADEVLAGRVRGRVVVDVRR